MILGLTGGIACGKSTVLSHLQERTSWPAMDADEIVRELLDDAGVKAEVCERIDPRACDGGGQINRAFLRELVFNDGEEKKTLESILHPKVRAIWTGEVRKARADGTSLIVDIPLLFETGVEAEFDAVLSVLCSGEVQEVRLREKRGLSAEIAKKMIASQLPSRLKMQKSAFVIWNDGSLNALVSQTDQLVRLLSTSIYG